MTTADNKKRDRKGAQLALELEPALLERLRAHAAADGRPVSTLVRRWIEAGLDGEADSTEDSIPRSEFTDLVDIVTLIRNEVTELSQWRSAHDGYHHAQITEPIDGDLISMADLAGRWGITANTVSRRLSFLGIKPIRQGNYRFITAEQLALGDELQQHILSGKPMSTFQQPNTNMLQSFVRMSDWIDASGLSRSTAYELLRILQIEPEARRVSTSRKPVSHLSAEQIQRLQPWANKIKHGATLPQIREQTQNQLAELVDQLPLSRSSVFELVKALGITTEKGPGPGGKGRVAWVSDADADRLADAANRVHRGEVRIADLAANMDHPSLL